MARDLAAPLAALRLMLSRNAHASTTPSVAAVALGGMGGTLLGSFAAAFAGSLVAQSLFSEFGGEEAGATGDGAEKEASDAGGDSGGGDFGGGEFGGGDIGF